ncbi:MAG TPA: glycosyltransferase family 2 protein [Patescibacteria group bacterium]
MNKLSVLIIAKNEEKMIGECLESVGWADEVIVIDTGSNDATKEIVKKHGVKVVSYLKGKNYSEWRNYALKLVSNDWILFVDADERVTPGLKDEIRKTIEESGGFSAYAIPRRNVFLGHEMRHGGWWPDYVLRLLRKEKVKGYRGEVHEQPEIEGEVGKLKEPFIHITHRSLTEMVEKTNKWSEIEARLMFEANHPPMNVIRFMTAMFREFWYRGIIKLGFLDGPVGIIEIIYQVFSRFVSYAKLWEMQQQTSKN